MYTLTDAAAHKMYTYSSTRSGGKIRKRKGKKNVHLYWPQNQGIAAQSVRAAGKSTGGVWVHIGVHNLKRMPANAGAGIGVHFLQ